MENGFCTAPWTHAHIGAQGGRRLCCISRERESNPLPPTGALADFWNGDFLRGVRRRMLQGENVEACADCDTKAYGDNVLRDYYNKKFSHLVPAIRARTSADGTTDLAPVSFDYRSSLCNFKCRICYEGNSSSLEKEASPSFGPKEKSYFARSEQRREAAETYDREIVDAAIAGRLEELYWAGGEPLVMERHWTTMRKLVDLGCARDLFVRYSTNLSRITYEGTNLLDLLAHFRRVDVYASLDGTGALGEFLRTGLDWRRWRVNAEQFRTAPPHVQFTIDFTLTLPGLFGLEDLLREADRLGFPVTAKLMFSSALKPHDYLSPLALPRTLLLATIDRALSRIAPFRNEKNNSVFELLESLPKMQTLAERFPDDWKVKLAAGYRHSRTLAELRKDGREGRLSIEEIFATYAPVAAWWEGIAAASSISSGKTQRLRTSESVASE